MISSRITLSPLPIIFFNCSSHCWRGEDQPANLLDPVDSASKTRIICEQKSREANGFSCCLDVSPRQAKKGHTRLSAFDSTEEQIRWVTVCPDYNGGSSEKNEKDAFSNLYRQPRQNYNSSRKPTRSFPPPEPGAGAGPILLSPPSSRRAMKTILFADDDRVMRTVFKRVFEDEGYHVVLARNGIEALDLFRKELPDAVVLDIYMPAKDGLQVAEEIRESFPEIAIILYTGHDDLCTRNSRARFASACVEKRTDLAELKRAVFQASLHPGKSRCLALGCRPYPRRSRRTGGRGLRIGKWRRVCTFEEEIPVSINHPPEPWGSS